MGFQAQELLVGLLCLHLSEGSWVSYWVWQDSPLPAGKVSTPSTVRFVCLSSPWEPATYLPNDQPWTNQDNPNSVEH